MKKFLSILAAALFAVTVATPSFAEEPASLYSAPSAEKPAKSVHKAKKAHKAQKAHKVNKAKKAKKANKHKARKAHKNRR